MKVKKIIGSVLNIVFYLLLVFMIYTSFKVVTATRNGKQPEIFGYKFYVVLTGSMKPNIEPNDLIIIKNINPDDIKSGDIITFQNENVDSVTTHRVKEVTESDGSVSLITKGDANNIEDENPVKGDKVQGRVVKVIPKAGRTVDFMKKNIVIILAVIVASFALIIIIFALIKCLKKKEIKKV